MEESKAFKKGRIAGALGATSSAPLNLLTKHEINEWRKGYEEGTRRRAGNGKPGDSSISTQTRGPKDVLGST